MKKLWRIFFNRLSVVVVLLAIQFLILTLAIWKLSNQFTYFYIACVLLSIIVGIGITKSSMNPTFKFSWIILVFTMPVFGGLFYLYFAKAKPGKKTAKQIGKCRNNTFRALKEDKSKIDLIDNRIIAGQFKYIENVCSITAYENTSTKYYPLGEDFYKDLLLELKNAKEYIFLEYFIIHEGKMLNSIIEILKDKAKEGLDVRLIYDDAGSINLVSDYYPDILKRDGIKAIKFNPFVPALSTFLQNRDHRKIAIIDGHTAFTGGVNLADEYINEIKRFGHWKDCAVRLKGEGAYPFTLMFLEIWNYYMDEEIDFIKYKADSLKIKEEGAGFVQPYCDSPYDNEEIGECVYINMFNNATKYIYIFTPYLIIGNELSSALILAAKKGVDVRIITPGIPDKPYVHFTTRSYYSQLINGGVKIYEYSKGFVHSKVALCDDSVASVGTVNLDYRSFYHHFECGVLMYRANAINKIKNDFVSTLADCRKVTGEELKVKSSIYKLGQAIMKIVAPLM